MCNLHNSDIPQFNIEMSRRGKKRDISEFVCFGDKAENEMEAIKNMTNLSRGLEVE